MAELVTGHAGSNHVDATDIRSLLREVIGNINCVGASASTTLTPSMTLKMPKMDIFWLTEDVGHIRLDGTESVSLTNTSLGMYRRDLICVKYSVSNNVESASVEVVQGTAAASESLATRPTYTNTTTAKYLPIYEVVINYNTATSCTFLLGTLQNLSNDGSPIKVENGGTGVESVYEIKQLLGILNSGITILTQSNNALCFRLEGLGLKVLLLKQSLSYQANSVVTYNINYGQTFTEIPMVFVQALTSTPTKRSASAGNRTTTGCSIYVQDEYGKSAEGSFCIMIIGKG